MNRFEPIHGKADILYVAPSSGKVEDALWNKLEYLQADNAKLQADLKDLREKMNELNSATLEIVARDIGKVKQSVKEAKAEVKTEVQQLSQELRQNFDDFKVMSGQKVLKVKEDLQSEITWETNNLDAKLFTLQNKLKDDTTAIYKTIGLRVEDLVIHFESKLNEIRPTIDLVYLVKVALKKLLRIK